jgi:hypothetical protein
MRLARGGGKQPAGADPGPGGRLAPEHGTTPGTARLHSVVREAGSERAGLGEGVRCTAPFSPGRDPVETRSHTHTYTRGSVIQKTHFPRNYGYYRMISKCPLSFIQGHARHRPHHALEVLHSVLPHAAPRRAALHGSLPSDARCHSRGRSKFQNPNAAHSTGTMRGTGQL